MSVIIYLTIAILVFVVGCVGAGYMDDFSLIVIGLSIAVMWPIAIPMLSLYWIGTKLREMHYGQ